uniref:NADH-ubiquinone oxidoreductase chain 4L n=1 Tax=Pselaphinae sp. 8 EF-2015 TaxID=1756862 RepID=A0A0S2M8U4_9COLE|nr:NADH deshydrogenase subunit 4L [Pselaphinae sp. 8 EF-2015]
MYMYIMSLLVFSLNHKHLLLMLLSLELIVLSLFLNLFLMLVKLNIGIYFSMIFLIMMVCESVLGLSILVSLIRTHGNDYIKSMSMLW